MRSSASAISELSADPSDPFNQALDDNSDWRLNLGYATEDSSFNVGELRTLRASDKARSDELLPVHVINLVVEDHDFATSPHKSPRVKVPKKPFRLQLLLISPIYTLGAIVPMKETSMRPVLSEH